MMPKAKEALTLPERRKRVYVRRDFLGDVLYWNFRYRDIDLSIPKKKSIRMRVQDEFVQALLSEKLVLPEEVCRYDDAVRCLFDPIEKLDEFTPEELYAEILSLRTECFGTERVNTLIEKTLKSASPLVGNKSIDQSFHKKSGIAESSAVLFLLQSPSLAAEFLLDLKEAVQAEKDVYLLYSDTNTSTLLSREQLLELVRPENKIAFLRADGTDPLSGCEVPEALKKGIREARAFLCAYGEEGLLQCRSLRMDSVVTAIPYGFAAKASTALLGESKPCCVYIPKGLDITAYLPLKARTILSYRQLFYLEEDHGTSVYSQSVESLYRAYPQYFFSVYENADHSPETASPFPIRFPSNCTLTNFQEARDEATVAYLNQFENLEYCSTYFDASGAQAPIPWNQEAGGGVLVQAARIKSSEGAKVIFCKPGQSPRRYFQENGQEETALFTNFLFFLTPKLAAFHQDLRADRPFEQNGISSGHLDYLLLNDADGRTETFPLFRKMCVAAKKNGEFLFFNFRLGGGEITLCGEKIAWAKKDVDPISPASVALFTPHSSCPDRNAVREEYRKTVGEGRVNFVIAGDRVMAVRRGDVILPAFGVVLSLEERMGEELLSRLALPSLPDGYYDPATLKLSVKLNAPEQIPAKEWDEVIWSFGGGLSLILDGKALTEEKDLDAWFDKEGWMSPLSRQTQESTLHQMVKHPRCAIGACKNKDLVLLVFSGRTALSSGADYAQMCNIAKAIYPDVEHLMNVDGGGSAVMGLAKSGRMVELSLPSTSSASTVGMIRPVNTLFYLPLKERN